MKNNLFEAIERVRAFLHAAGLDGIYLHGPKLIVNFSVLEAREGLAAIENVEGTRLQAENPPKSDHWTLP